MARRTQLRHQLTPKLHRQATLAVATSTEKLPSPIHDEQLISPKAQPVKRGDKDATLSCMDENGASMKDDGDGKK